MLLLIWGLLLTVNACVSTSMSGDMKNLFTKKKGILNFAIPKSAISLPTNVNRNVICFSSSSTYFSSIITTKYSRSQDSVPTPLSLSSSISPSSNAASNSHSSKVAFSEFDSLKSKTGDKVSSNIRKSVTVINNLPANNLPVTSDDIKKLLGNRKDVSTFCSLKNVSNADKLTFIRNIFIPGKSFGFPKKSDEKGDRPFQHSWLENFPWLCYSLMEDGAYCMYCVLFNGGSSGRKIQLVHTPFKTWSDAQHCFRKHSESKTGIHSKSMDNYKEFLKQVFGKKDLVEQLLSKSTVKQAGKNSKVLLSIIDAIKTIGKMGVPLRGHGDDSRYQPDVREPANHPGVGNFIELVNFAVRKGNQTLGHHLKTCSSRETYILKTTKNLLLTCCYDIMTKAIIGRVKEA